MGILDSAARKLAQIARRAGFMNQSALTQKLVSDAMKVRNIKGAVSAADGAVALDAIRDSAVFNLFDEMRSFRNELGSMSRFVTEAGESGPIRGSIRRQLSTSAIPLAEAITNANMKVGAAEARALAAYRIAPWGDSVELWKAYNMGGEIRSFADARLPGYEQAFMDASSESLRDRAFALTMNKSIVDRTDAIVKNLTEKMAAADKIAVNVPLRVMDDAVKRVGPGPATVPSGAETPVPATDPESLTALSNLNDVIVNIANRGGDASAIIKSAAFAEASNLNLTRDSNVSSALIDMLNLSRRHADAGSKAHMVRMSPEFARSVLGSFGAAAPVTIAGAEATRRELMGR